MANDMDNNFESVTVRRFIDADRDIVFGAFSSAEALARWFSPSADIAIAIEAFEFQEQGGFRLQYAMPDGLQPTVSGVFEHIERPGKIVFSWVWHAPDPHADVPTRVTVNFNEQGRGTELVLCHEMLPAELCERHHAGWVATLDRLLTNSADVDVCA